MRSSPETVDQRVRLPPLAHGERPRVPEPPAGLRRHAGAHRHVHVSDRHPSAHADADRSGSCQVVDLGDPYRPIRELLAEHARAVADSDQRSRDRDRLVVCDRAYDARPGLRRQAIRAADEAQRVLDRSRDGVVDPRRGGQRADREQERDQPDDGDVLNRALPSLTGRCSAHRARLAWVA
jgi:hypothetical protein